MDNGQVIMDNEQLVPELRFSGFEDDWSKSLIGSLLKIGSGKDYKHLNTGDIPVYGTGGYMTSVDDYLHDGESVCIGRKGTIDKPMFLKGKFWTVDTLFFTHSYQQNIPKFLYLIFQRINWKKYNEASGVPSLSKKTIEKIKIVVPKPKEQQKIANFLTAIDQRITLLKQKKATLEDYKKGLMQKIFSQEVRFKDDEGNDFPDWEVKLFSKLYEFKRTNSFSRDKLNNQSGEIQNIHYGDIHTKFKSHFNINDEDVPYVNDEVDLSKVKVDEFIQAGDLIIADASEDYDDIGKVIEATNVDDKKIIAGLHTFLARRINDKLSVGFAGLMMQSEHVRLQIKKIAQGTKVLGISMGRLSKIKLKIPCPEEQQKIANFLSAIDQKINAMDKQITDSELFKKGLLQRMFV